MIYTGCIYAHILHAENSKQDKWMYIGQAEDVNKRWAQKENSYRDCKFIYRELCKYGWESFDHIILEDNIPVELLDEKEIYWINKYHTCVYDPKYSAGFNLTFGGSGCRCPKPSMKGKIPKNISMLAQKKYKQIVCINTGIWNGIEYKKDQKWNSLKECQNYFKMSQTWVWHRLNHAWNIISGPVFSYTDNYDETIVNFDKKKNDLKTKQQEAGKQLSSIHKNGSKINYSILCEETGEMFNVVSDCLKQFNMSRSTLNGHINYPDKHPTAKGYHFKRIPKTNTDS